MWSRRIGNRNKKVLPVKEELASVFCESGTLASTASFFATHRPFHVVSVLPKGPPPLWHSYALIWNVDFGFGGCEPQLLQCTGFDLPHSLLGDSHGLADLFEG